MVDRRQAGTEGFSLVEIIIAMFLLGIAAMVLLPLLYQGILVSGLQSTTATATREVAAQLDAARTYPTCANIAALLPLKSYQDASGHTFTVSGTQSPATCSQNSTVTLTFIARSSAGQQLSTATALIYVYPVVTPSPSPSP